MNNKEYFYLRIEGDVEEVAEKNFPLTIFSSFRRETNETVIKVHCENYSFFETVLDMYEVLGEIKFAEHIKV